MRGTIIYDHEEENGEITTYEAEYEIAPYHPSTYWQPEEGGDVELLSVKTNGEEVQDLKEVVYNKLIRLAEEDSERFDWDIFKED